MHIANLSVADALTSLRSAEHGLTSAEAEKRLREFGLLRHETRASRHRAEGGR